MALSVSKTNAYAVLGPPEGLSATKATAYAVLGPPAGVSAAKANVYAVLDTPSAPAWPSFSFGAGTVSSAYSQSFSATGSPTITYTVQSGSLPTGLSLAGNTISGTPTTVGTYSFTLRASNSYGTADQAFSITVSVGGDYPAAADVRYGVSYAGGAYTGTLVVPSADDVRDGTAFDTSSTGNLELPAEADVRIGTGYGTNGTEFTGTLSSADAHAWSY